MRTIDFSVTGGRGFTQGDLNFMQRGYEEYATALASMGAYGLTVGVIMSGMVLTGTVLTAGYFCLNGKIYYTPGGDTGVIPGGGFTYGLTIVTDPTDVPFANGTLGGPRKYLYGEFGSVPNSPGPNQYKLNTFKRFGEVFGARQRESWQTITVSAGFGTTTGTIQYKRDYLTNTLLLSGTLTSANPSAFGAIPSSSTYIMATMDANHRPAADRVFIATVSGNTWIKDFTGDVYLRQLNCKLTSSGDIGINFVKPDAGVSAYTVQFDVIIPLD